MANKEKIERGRALHRLIADDGFLILLKEWDETLEGLCSARDNWDGHGLDHNAGLVRLCHRIGALSDLKQWIYDQIEIGGSEKLKQELEGA